MTELVVRRLLVDLKSPIPVRWNGGDAFRSAFFNALSLSFPVGEQFFIDSVRNGVKRLPDDVRERFATEVHGFIGQEATHRHLHALFNAHLDQAGIHNYIEARAKRRIAAHAHRDPRMHVAATAAIEHFTALFADWMLGNPEALQGAEPRLQTLWLWHSAEESEHRSTAMDVYSAMGGDHKRRVRVFNIITVIFLSEVLWQTLYNLWQDRSLFKWSTWRSAWKLLFSPQGLVRSNVGQWRDYKAENFHPSQHDGRRGIEWLRDNATAFTPVTQSS